MKKNMLSQQDIKQVRVIVREELTKTNARVADLSVRMNYLEEDMTEVKANTRKILDNLDSYAKRSTDLEVEQKAHAEQLNRHESWITKANKKLKITR